jgi:hypothetical protein
MMAGLSAVPGGTGLIDFLGHMAPSHRLQTELLGKPLLGPLGSSCWFDGAGVATAAWARFGFGFVELGPWWGSAPIVDSRFRVNLSQKSPAMESSVSLLPVSMMQARLRQCPSSIACLVRLMPGQAMAPTAAASELVEFAHSLVDRVLGFSVDLRLASVGWGRADWDVFWRCLTTERDPIKGKAAFQQRTWC